MEVLDNLIYGLADSPWLLILAFAAAIVSRALRSGPSESVVVAIAAIRVSTGADGPLVLWAVVVAGFLVGGWLVRRTAAPHDRRASRQVIGRSLRRGAVWGLCTVSLGALTGAWLMEHPLLAMSLAVIFALLLRVAVDAAKHVAARWPRRTRAAAPSIRAAGGAAPTVVVADQGDIGVIAR